MIGKKKRKEKKGKNMLWDRKGISYLQREWA